MKIVFTGPCDLFTRNEFKELLDRNSFIIQSAVSGKTDLLITNDVESKIKDFYFQTKKFRDARRLGIRIIEYKEFLYEYIPEYII